MGRSGQGSSKDHNRHDKDRIMFDFYYAWYKYWSELLFEVQALRNLHNINRDKIERLEEIVYGGYV